MITVIRLQCTYFLLRSYVFNKKHSIFWYLPGNAGDRLAPFSFIIFLGINGYVCYVTYVITPSGISMWYIMSCINNKGNNTGTHEVNI